MDIEKSRDFSAVSDFLKVNFSAPTHWPGWNVLVSKTFHTDFYYLVAREKGSIAGICPIHEATYKRFLKKQSSGQFHYIPFGGWIFSRDTIVGPGFFPLGLQSFSEIYTLPLLEEFNCRYEIPGLIKKSTLIVDLELPEEALWRSLNPAARKYIRKAARMNIEARLASSAAHFSDFYNLYAHSSTLNKLPLLDRDFFSALRNECPDISVDILMAVKNGVQVANLVMVSDKNYAFSWMTNNGSKAGNEGQGDLLYWESFKLAKNRGCRYYDLCHIEPERLPGIYQFKKKFSDNERLLAYIIQKPLLFKFLNKIIRKGNNNEL